MANNSLTIHTNRFFALVLKSPIQMGWLSIINSVTNISRLGTFNPWFYFRAVPFNLLSEGKFEETWGGVGEGWDYKRTIQLRGHEMAWGRWLMSWRKVYWGKSRVRPPPLIFYYSATVADFSHYGTLEYSECHVSWENGRGSQEYRCTKGF